MEKKFIDETFFMTEEKFNIHIKIYVRHKSNRIIKSKKYCFTFTHVIARANVCGGETSKNTYADEYFQISVETLNIRRRVSRFRVEYYPVHYTQFVCI